MKEITMYKCEYCEKLFKTIKHNCKKDPKLKNCFSCKHLDHFEDKHEMGSCGDPSYRKCNPVCGHSDNYEKETEDIIDVMYHNKPKWNLECEGWKNKWGE